MAEQGSEGEDRPQSLTEETTTTNSTGTLIPPLPTLPFDVQYDILCRLPVKLLVQLRCLSKSYNSLISDPNFAKKHLRLSTKRHHLMTISSNKSGKKVVGMYDSPLTSVFSGFTVPQKRLNYDTLSYGHVTSLCSCDGIFCLATDNMSIVLWNPSLSKHKILPPLDMLVNVSLRTIGFGYDRVIDNYKTIFVTDENEVSVNILGTDYWRKILDLPSSLSSIVLSAKFVSGTINWMAGGAVSVYPMYGILSLDLEKETYQMVPKPDFETTLWCLGVVKDCLCVFATSQMFMDIWIMKEYGNKDSWTKLYTVPDMLHDWGLYTALYVSEDDQLLLEFNAKMMPKGRKHSFGLVVYDSKNGTSNILEFQNKQKNNHFLRSPQVYIESLIAP